MIYFSRMQRVYYCLIVILLFISGKTSATADHTKIYVLHFPQFHNDKLNNEIWGDGFTDWNNLNQTPALNRLGEPILRPHADIGYYDQALYSTRRLQGELARKYGVDGFIYHHYWFYHQGEKATLATPLENMLLDGEPNVSFAFNWATDSWTRTWHGSKDKRERDIGGLLHEQLCPEKHDGRVVSHYEFLRRFFHHPNYIKIHGVPLFSLFRPKLSKNDGCYTILERLQELAVNDGFPLPGLHIVHAGGNDIAHHEIYTKAASVLRLYDNNSSAKLAGHFFYPVPSIKENAASLPSRCFSKDFAAEAYHWKPQYISTVVGFDNTPRRDFNRAHVFDRSKLKVNINLDGLQTRNEAVSWRDLSLPPDQSLELDLVHLQLYERCCQEPSVRERGGKFVVINAWNEWGEGMCLEPSVNFGYQFLEAVSRAKAVAGQIFSSSPAQCDWGKYRKYLDTKLQRFFSK